MPGSSSFPLPAAEGLPAHVLGPAQRSRDLARLADEEFDLLVIGGGATGCGAALDAASRGLRVALVEQRDLTSGTSSRSSKLVHGGLRYLEQFRFSLVYEALRERQLLLTALAPHLVRPVSFLYPLRHWAWERPYVGAGIGLYDALAGLRARGDGMPAHRHLSRRGALELAPGLAASELTGGVRYYDAQMDDARLGVAIARTAAEYGAVVTTGTPVVSLLRRGPRIAGAVVRDEETGDAISVRAKAVLGCVGVWTEQLHRLAGVDYPSPLRVRTSKGVHLVVPKSAIESSTGLILRTERSVLFVIPWEDQWLVGTTDTPWEGDLADPAVTSSDVDYLLSQINGVLDRPLTRSDVVGVFAGLRPLVDTGATDTARVSREHVVAELAPGLVAIAGGKWTTYRVMAADAVTETMKAAGYARPPRTTTDRIPLIGARGHTEAARRLPALAVQAGLSAEAGARLAERYGAAGYDVLRLARDGQRLSEPIPGVPQYLRAEVTYAAAYEGARTLADVLDRRLRLSLLGPVSSDTAEDVARIAGEVLGWDDVRRASEVTAYERNAEAMHRAMTLALDTEADAVLRAALV